MTDQEFAERFERYRPLLMTSLRRLLRNYADCEDALQSAMLKAWRGRSRFLGQCSWESWVFRIAMNAGKDLLRTEMRRTNYMGVRVPFDFAVGAPIDELLQDEALIERETWAARFKLLEILPANERAAICMERAPKAVRVRKWRAKQKLLQKLKVRAA